MTQELNTDMTFERVRACGMGASLFTVLCGLLYCSASGPSAGETQGTWHDGTIAWLFGCAAGIAVLCFLLATIGCGSLLWRLLIIAILAGVVCLNGWLNGQCEFASGEFIATFLIALIGLPVAMVSAIVALNLRSGKLE